MGNWWAATPLEEWPTSRSAVQSIIEDFEPPLGGAGGDGGPAGDRRQEIVFIGMGLDQVIFS